MRPQRWADGMLPLNNCQLYQIREHHYWDFPRGTSGKEPACKCRLGVRDTGLIPGLGRSPGEGNDYPLQYSCLDNFMDRGAWWATVLGAAKNWTWLNDWHFHCTSCMPGTQLSTWQTLPQPILRDPPVRQVIAHQQMRRMRFKGALSNLPKMAQLGSARFRPNRSSTNLCLSILLCCFSNRGKILSLCLKGEKVN